MTAGSTVAVLEYNIIIRRI